MDEGPRVRRDRSGDAGFVSLLQAGDESAFGLLVDAWADSVYDRLSHRGFTTADALDLSAATFAEAHGQIVDGPSPDPFGVQVLRIARHQAAAADDRRVDLFLAVGPFAGDRLIHATDARALAGEEPVATFLQEAAVLLGESASEVLDLHERYQFDDHEIAALLGIPIDAVADLTVSTPDAFREMVGLQLVWRQGTPACSELAAALVRHRRLEAGTRRAITEHLRGCDRCRAAATPAVDPVTVVAAIPIAMAPAGFRPALVETLAQIGLDVSGSVAYRLPRGARGMAAAPPPPPKPPPYPSFVAAPPPPTAAGRADRPPTVPPPVSAAAQREPELAALMIGDFDEDEPPPARFLRVVPDLPRPEADGDRADDRDDEEADPGPVDDEADAIREVTDGEWVDDWRDEGLVPDPQGAMLAPPPPADAPAPVVPAFEPTLLSPAARTADPAPTRRKRWFRTVEA